jgi:IclR family transcriptional regulator, pca regulon regulatory protein
MAEPSRRYFVESVERALRILEALSKERRGLKLGEIASVTGMDVSTTFRLLYTLESLGYLNRDDSKRYSLGGKILAQGLAALTFSYVVERAQPYVADLFERSCETTDLAIRDGVGAVVVALCKAPSVANASYSVGIRLPLHCSAVGKALLSDHSPDQVRALLGAGPYRRLTPESKLTFEELVAELERVRRQKYGVADRELNPDVRGVAAPVRDATGAIAAAVSITVASELTSREELEARMAPLVVSAATAISQALGAPSWTNAMTTERPTAEVS